MIFLKRTKHLLKRISVISCLLIIIISTLGCVDTASMETGTQIRKDILNSSDPERFTVTYEGAIPYDETKHIRVIHDNELNVTIYQTMGGHGYEYITAISDKDL